jgi:hypothetical protein
MTVHISRMLGWKKVEKRSLPKYGIAKSSIALNTRLATSILGAYDIPQEIRSPETNGCLGRTVDALLLKRTQMLQ